MSSYPGNGEKLESTQTIQPMDSADHLDRLADPLVGFIIASKYQVISRLGEGSMGTVYLVEHMELGKKMAVKVLKSKYSSDDMAVERFRREARAACKVGNPHIIEISDYGALPDDRKYFVMELLQGESLASLINREAPMPFPLVAKIALQICDGLHAAHEEGIVHRDIKPENLFLNQFKSDILVKILDFGIAKSRFVESDNTLTQAGFIFGTPNFISPEQGQGRVADRRSDIYSLGVTLYLMTTGRYPFLAPSPVLVVSKHIMEAPVPPAARTPFSASAKMLNHVILKAMNKEPEDRYQSSQEMADAIFAILDSFSTEERLSIQSVVTTNPSLPITGSSRRRRTRTMLMVLLVLSLMLLTFVATVVAIRMAQNAQAPEKKVALVSFTPPGGARQDVMMSHAVPPDLAAIRADGAQESLVLVETMPSGATVIQDGKELGHSPLTVPLSRPTKLTFRLGGYREETLSVEPHEEEVLVEMVRSKAVAKAPRAKVAPKGPPKKEPPKKATKSSSPFEKFSNKKLRSLEGP